MSEEKKTSLFEITSTIQAIIAEIVDTGGEVTEESFAELAEFKGAFEVKATSIAYVVKSVMQNRIDHMKGLKEQISKKLTIEENAQKRLMEYLKKGMIATDSKKVEGDLYSVTLIKAKKKLNIIDPGLTPQKYITHVSTKIINNAAITADLKAGEEVEGYELIDGEPGLRIA